MHKWEIHTTTQYRAETMYNYFSNLNKSKLNLVNHMTHTNYEIASTHSYPYQEHKKITY